jgi:hydroxymethylpyrimidine/phosphomethylpyrimidine kinase
VVAVTALDPELVAAQVRAVVDDLAPGAVKTGMLANPAVVATVAGLAAEGLLPHLVVDPVLVSTSGHPLMAAGGVEAYIDLLVPWAQVLTPNLREAALLLGTVPAELDSTSAMTEAATALRQLGAGTVVVKGGHVGDRQSPDVVAGPDGVVVLDAERVDTANDHGTGCTLSAAICANLALGHEVGTAVAQAKAYVLQALKGAAGWRLGSGHGPVDHFGWTAPEP